MHEKIYPVLPLRDIVVFPHMAVPLFIGRVKSVQSVSKAIELDRSIILVSQIDQNNENPTADEIYSIGVLGKVMQLLQLPDGTAKVLIEGIERVKVKNFTNEGDYFQAEYETIKIDEPKEEENEALKRMLLYNLDQYTRFNRKISVDVLKILKNTESVDRLVDIIATYLIMTITEKQEILEILDVNKRVEKILAIMESEIDVLNAERRIKNRVKKQIEKNQREYYLNEQIKAIQKELGDEYDETSEIAEFEENSKKIKLSPEAQEKIQHELKRLKSMPPLSAESSVVRNYIDLVLSLPWDYKTECNNDLFEAKKVLDNDHYGFEKVKDRILEFLAVQDRVGKTKGQILCFVGPPGVGKTSLAKSIAQATNRKYVRLSLGGVRDESEIRGHRRTYIGSMPGKIIQGMKKAKTSNPLMLLDELDKLGSDWRGDPASALLEVLDSEQNENFNDHYLEIGYDLSNVMFIATANSLNMPKPLLDRLEIVNISGYTEFEKLEIAKRYLVPKQMQLHKLTKKEFEVDNDVLMRLIQNYTRESGVRNLEREVANLTRKAVRELYESKEILPKKNITKDKKIKKQSKSEVVNDQNKPDVVGGVINNSNDSVVDCNLDKSFSKNVGLINKNTINASLNVKNLNDTGSLNNPNTDCAQEKINHNNTLEKDKLNSDGYISNISERFENADCEINVSAACIGKKHVKITLENMEKYAGIPKIHHFDSEKEHLVGVVNGLAWTEVGGELLSIEALMMPGKGKMTLTGKLGDVIQESIQASLSLVKSRSVEFNIDAEIFEKNDFHVHLPEGATPKDGPSAGIAIVIALLSVLTKTSVRYDVAMTGEITLSGRVLPIGGLKEKLLAAIRSKITIVLIPFGNLKDLEEIPQNIKESLTIIPIKQIDEAFDVAFYQSLPRKS